jgi:hypothetical protein
VRPRTLVYLDHYRALLYYGAARSRDLKNWTDVSSKMKFPFRRQGSRPAQRAY